MKKKLLSVLLAGSMVLSLAACGSGDSGSTPQDSTATQQTDTTTEPAQNTTAAEDSASNAAADPTNGELVDGKFVDTRKITVEVYDRGNDDGSDPTYNNYTKWIKEQMLERHNVEVEFVAVPRWTEVEQINNLLAAGDAPDICLTYDYPTVLTYANMGGVLDLSSYVDDYKSLLPNLWDWLGETNIYWDKDPVNGTLWAVEGKRAVTNRINTFVRKDWLDKLGLQEPTTRQEFEDMIIAFRDNADTLLGADADKMIPYSVSFDVGWRAALLIESFIDPEISDYEYYINGFDDRALTQNGTKEAMRLLNKWYNEDLLWDDFALYGSGDSTEDDMIKAGYVGAFMHNWDYPYRDGENSIQTNLSRIVGPDAKYVVVDCFEDKNGGHNKFVTSTAGDRKIFFPTTNDEPLASMLYLDYTVEIIAATGDDIQNSGFNIDYTITCNGLHLTDEDLTLRSMAYSYSGIDPELVKTAHEICNTDIRRAKNVNVGAITSEEGQGPTLSSKRDVVYDTALSAPVDKFDEVWDAGIADYLSSGGQAIIDERAEKWKATFGDATSLPE